VGLKVSPISGYAIRPAACHWLLCNQRSWLWWWWWWWSVLCNECSRRVYSSIQYCDVACWCPTDWPHAGWSYVTDNTRWSVVSGQSQAVVSACCRTYYEQALHVYPPWPSTTDSTA